MNKDLINYLKIDKSVFSKFENYPTFNSELAQYYSALAAEQNTLEKAELLIRKAQRIEDCNSFILVDSFEESKVKIIKRSNLCKIKFCSNCKHLLQAERQYKFEPFLSTEENLYHIVFTVPNCGFEELKPTVRKMNEAFKRLLKFLSGKKNIRNVDFPDGYLGAVKSVEITFNNEKWNFHPHLHCAFSFSKSIDLSGNNFNKFSFDKYHKKNDRPFSDFEIQIQKIFKLLFENLYEDSNGKFYQSSEVTKFMIDNLEIGYSVICDQFKKGDYNELFKYITKGDFVNLPYEVFKALDYTCFRLRQIQGYGKFYKIKDDDFEHLDKLSEDYYYNYILKPLFVNEKPYCERTSIQEMATDTEFNYLSKRKFKKLYFEESKS